MKKILTLLSIMAILLVSSVFAAVDVSVTPSSISGIPGESATFTINVANTDAPNTSISTVLLTSSVLTLDSDTAHTITAPTINSVSGVNSSKTQTFTITIPNSKKAGSYVGILTATESGNSSNNDTVSYSVVINPLGALSTDVSALNLFDSPSDDDYAEQVFTITNTGSSPLSGLVVSHNIANLTDADGRVMSLSFSPTTATLAPGQSTTVNARAKAESGMSVKTFTGKVVVSATGLTGSVTPMDLTVKSQPLTCQKGNSGSLTVTIERPDAGDEFEPGQEFTLEVNVDNNYASDKDIMVEAQLYNLDKSKKVYSVKSSKNIDNDEDETFLLKMKMEENTKEDDYKLFIKVYDEEDENDICKNYEVSIDITVPEDKLTIESFSMSPATAVCSDNVEALLQIKNVGSDDQDNVRVVLKNSYLGVNAETSISTIDSGKSGNVQYARLSFAIPKYAVAGTYKILATVFFSGNSVVQEKEITVNACPTATTTQQTQPVVTQTPPTTTSNTQVASKDLFDLFNNNSLVSPTSFWLLMDVLLVVGIIVLLVALFRPKQY